MKKLFLISSQAVASEYSFRKEDIVKVYAALGRLDEIYVEETKYPGHIYDILDEFISMDIEDKVVIILGGDGSLNEVANRIYGHNIGLGLIPTVTGNDFAKNFDYKNFKITDTFDISLRPIDLIKINDMYCVNVTSLGFDTAVLARAYEYLDIDKSLGKRAYLKAVADKLKNLIYENLTINLHLADGSTVSIHGEFLISAICNGSYYESTFNPAPDAKIDDGIINLILA